MSGLEEKKSRAADFKTAMFEKIIGHIIIPGDQMTAREYGYIADIICSRNGCNLLVFGVGRDSVLWLIANQGGKTVFLEDSDQWMSQAKNTVPGIDVRKITYQTKRSDWETMYRQGDAAHRLDLPEDVLTTEWEVILVDAPEGYSDDTPGRMLSIFSASMLSRKKPGADIFIHDFDRKVERIYAMKYFGRDEKVVAFDRLIHFRARGRE